MRRRTKKAAYTPPAEFVLEPVRVSAPVSVPVPDIPDEPRTSRPRQVSHKRIAGALLFSLIFHLSMVTVFRIVVYFPHAELVYREFHIVQAPVESTQPATPSESPEHLTLGGLPPIELPTIEFAELARLRERQASLDASARYKALLAEDEPKDSWRQFVTGMQELPKTLSRLSLSGGSEPRPPVPAQEEIAFVPATGFVGKIEWGTPPKDRQVLFAPPIQALWEAGSDAFKRPMELVLEVNPSGRVVSVWNPAAAEDPLGDQVQAAMLKYRFALRDGTDNQLATIRIRPEDSKP